MQETAEREIELQKKKLLLTNKNLYIAKYIHLNTRGQKMSFDKLPFLVEIYKQLNKSRVVTVMKSVQTGISEAFIIQHLMEADNGLAIQYVLPKGELRNRFVQFRINRLTKAIPYYTQRMQDAKAKADSVVLKKFGKGIVNYIDSNSTSNFTEFPGDALYIDEVDRCNQANVAMAPDRLSSSPFRLERYVGNPTVEEFGVHNFFLDGSQGYWCVKCRHCGEWQPFDWFVNVVRQIGKSAYEVIDPDFEKDASTEVGVFCRKCGKKLNRFQKAHWVHAYPKKEAKSYTLNKITSPFTTIRELVDKFLKVIYNETKLQLFYNSDLGIPYTAEGSKVTEQMLNETRLPKYVMPSSNKSSLAYAGIDVGAMFHIVIRRLTEIDGKAVKLALYIGSVRDEKDVLNLLDKYGVKLAVIDALPELRTVERMKKKNSKLYECFFGQVKLAKVDKKHRVMTFRRTALIDRVMEGFKSDEYKNPANLKDIPEYYIHMQSNTRILNEDGTEYEWVQSANPDHLFLAEAYACAACEMAIGSNIFEFYNALSKKKRAPKPDGRDEISKKEPKVYNSAQAFLDSLQKKY